MGSFDFDRYFKRKYKTITPEELTEEQIGEAPAVVIAREQAVEDSIEVLFKKIIELRK